MKRYLLVIAVLVILVAGIGVALRFYMYGGSKKSQGAAVTISSDSVFSEVSNADPSSDTTNVPPPVSQSTLPTPQATEGMRTYQNTAFHFGLLFPDTLHATEYKEQGGALTASFQDPSTNEGFQVYVTPYSGKQIDTARFKLDEPSGAYLQPSDVIVDGAHATKFFSKNGIMGDTREVWFVHGGFLYEVVTYKELDAWLSGIMQTWKFI